jgi:hypothetical protein
MYIFPKDQYKCIQRNTEHMVGLGLMGCLIITALVQKKVKLSLCVYLHMCAHACVCV